MNFSRWAPEPSSGGWTVKSEVGKQAPSPHTFSEYKPAISRSDELNRAEQYQNIGAKVP